MSVCMCLIITIIIIITLIIFNTFRNKENFIQDVVLTTSSVIQTELPKSEEIISMYWNKYVLKTDTRSKCFDCDRELPNKSHPVPCFDCE
jgi:hypothetical protein